MAGNITEYENPVKGLEPTELGVQSAYEAANRAGRFFNQLAEAKRQEQTHTPNLIGRGLASLGEAAGQAIDKYQTSSELSAGAPAATGLLSSLNNQWGQTLSDPKSANDPTLGANFQQNVLEPALQNFQSQFNTDSGKAWAQRQADSIRNHFVTDKIPLDMSNMAQQNLKTNLDKLDKTAQLDINQDPSSLDTHLNLLGQSVDGLIEHSPVPLGAKAQELKSSYMQTSARNYILSAIHGYANKPDNVTGAPDVNGGSLAMKIANDPKYAPYLSDDDRDAVSRYVDKARRVNDEAMAFKTQQMNADIKAEKEGFLGGIWDNARDLTPQTVQLGWRGADGVAHPWDNVQEREKAVNVLKAAQKALDPSNNVAPAVNDETTQHLRDLIHGNGDSQMKDLGPINDAVLNGTLSPASAKQLTAEFKTAQTSEGKKLAANRNEFMKGFGPSIDPNYSLGTGGAAQAKFNLQKALDTKEQELRAAGKDPNLLYTPGAKEFLGTGDFVNSFSRNLQSDLSGPQRFAMPKIDDPTIFKAANVLKSGLETKGDYSQLGKVITYTSGPKAGTTDQAIGAYQIMASNVPSWTQKYLGKSMTPSEFRADREAQDKVFAGEFGGYVKKYEKQGMNERDALAHAAGDWLGGPGALDNRPNSSDAHGGFGHKVWQYVDNFLHLWDKAGPAEASGPKAPTPQPEQPMTQVTGPKTITVPDTLEAKDVVKLYAGQTVTYHGKTYAIPAQKAEAAAGAEAKPSIPMSQ